MKRKHQKTLEAMLDAECSMLDTGSFTSIEYRASMIEHQGSSIEYRASSREEKLHAGDTRG
ncbi:MAG: hypothetical protein AB1797_09400 [bacterium]